MSVHLLRRCMNVCVCVCVAYEILCDRFTTYVSHFHFSHKNMNMYGSVCVNEYVCSWCYFVICHQPVNRYHDVT